MINYNLPKVLVIDVNAWRDDAASNTLMEVFRCWNPESLALVYTSSVLPNSNVCNRYFQIGENQVLKSVFKPWNKVGREVSTEETTHNKDAIAENNLRSFSQKSYTKIIRIIREFVWKMGRWKSPALNDFVQSFNPDIIFVPIFPYAYMGRIENYIIRLLDKPTVCYLADDNYSYDSCQSLLDYFHRFWIRKYVGPLAKNCKEMFVIIDKEKEDTDSRFGTNSVILTKAIDFKDRKFELKKVGTPIKFVYTGSLAIGRGETLALVADALNRMNFGNSDVELDIYSQTIPKTDILNRLNNGCAHFLGKVSHQEIEDILKDADVVIFAEAIEGKDRLIAKLSFSTKITDYLAAGKCILAIGDREIAPIDYFIKNDSAIIASTPEEIETRLKEILENHDLINIYGKKAFECAYNNHEKNAMVERFVSTMCRAAK